MGRIKFILAVLMLILTVKGALAVSVEETFTDLKLNDPFKKEAVFTLDVKAESLDSSALTIDFIEVCGKVEDYKILAYQPCLKERWVKDYIRKEVCTYDNKTLEPTCEEKDVLETAHKEEYYDDDYCEVKGITGAKDYKIVADIEPADCGDGFGYKVEWIPSIQLSERKLTQYAWAWFNASYQHRWNLTNEVPTADITMFINGTSGVEGVLHRVRPSQCGGSLAWYYLNSTELANGVIVCNDSTIITHSPSSYTLMYFPLDYNSTDMSSYHHSSTDQASITFENAGRVNASAHIPDNNGWVDIPDVASNEEVDAFTVMGWINRDTDGVGGQAVLSKNPTGYMQMLMIEPSDVGLLQIDSGETVATTSDYPVGTWSHMAMTYDGSGNGYAYHNGTQEATSSGLTDPELPDANNFVIGANSGGSGNSFAGYLDEIYWVNRTLSDGEISAYFNNTRPSPSNLIFSGSPETAPNNPPEITTISIVPSSPNSTTDISCNTTVTDDLNSIVDVEFFWYNQTGLIEAGNTTGVSVSTPTLVDTLGFGNYSDGDTINCTLRATDGTQYSPYNSTTVLITDVTPPVYLADWEFDTVQNVLAVFVVVIVWFGCLTLGYVFDNFIFKLIGYLVGFMVGFMFFSIHPFMTMTIAFLNVIGLANSLMGR